MEDISRLRHALIAQLEETGRSSLSTARRRALEFQIRQTIEELNGVLMGIDPIRMPTSVFDPGNPKIVGRFISLALVAQPRIPLTSLGQFYGSGVYALYYKGSFSLYADLSGSETPIYVGQAQPATSNALTPVQQGDRLSRRLNDHRRNISKAQSTLGIDDFEYRSLVVQSGWETAAEDYLIHLFRPIWNSETNILYGLGKHGDNAETRANSRSPWDTVHPGRTWAANTRLADAKSLHQISEEIAQHFAQHPVYKDLDAVLNAFIEELRQV